MRTLLLNTFGGPGTGKSTVCAAIFAELKFRGILCEMALEFAKDLVWERSQHLLANQIYVFGHQHHRITKLVGQVPIIISDSPLIHSVIYDSGENPHFAPMVLAEHRKHNNFNVFLDRIKPYDPKGRSQTEEEAKALDHQIADLLFSLEEEGRDYFMRYPATPESASSIARTALELAYELNTDFHGNPASEDAENFVKRAKS